MDLSALLVYPKLGSWALSALIVKGEGEGRTLVHLGRHYDPFITKQVRKRASDSALLLVDLLNEAVNRDVVDTFESTR